jgi:hypothetical protein
MRSHRYPSRRVSRQRLSRRDGWQWNMVHICRHRGNAKTLNDRGFVIWPNPAPDHPRNDNGAAGHFGQIDADQPLDAYSSSDADGDQAYDAENENDENPDEMLAGGAIVIRPATHVTIARQGNEITNGSARINKSLADPHKIFTATLTNKRHRQSKKCLCG